MLLLPQLAAVVHAARLIANSRKTPQRSYIGAALGVTHQLTVALAPQRQRTQLRALLLLTRDAAGRIDAPRRDGAGRERAAAEMACKGMHNNFEIKRTKLRVS